MATVFLSSFSLQLNHLLKLKKNFFEISTLWQVKSVWKQKRNKTLFFIHWPPLGHYLSKSHFYDGSSKTPQEKINWNKKFFLLKQKCFSSKFIGGVSDKNFSERVCPCASDVRFRWMKGNVKNTFVKFLSMRRDLLHAGFCFKVPQSNAAIVTCKKIKTKMTSAEIQSSWLNVFTKCDQCTNILKKWIKIKIWQSTPQHAKTILVSNVKCC